MHKLSEEKINQVQRLRKQGIAYKKIAKRLKIGCGSALKYAESVKLSKEAKLKLKKNESENWAKFVRKYAKEKEITDISLNAVKANIIGHLFFDGSVSINKGGKYRITYTNSSRKSLDCFIKNICAIYSIGAPKIQKHSGKTPVFHVEFYSKKLVKSLIDYSHSFSTTKNIGVPGDIKNATEEVVIGFMKAFWEDEGSIRYDGSIVGSSMSEKMIEDLIDLHESLNIKCTKQRNNSNGCFTIYIRDKMNNKLRFAEKIGFSQGKITRGKNKGRFKNDILFGSVSGAIAQSGRAPEKVSN